MEHQVEPLDGVSLLPVIEGTAKQRGKPMGFWDYPAPGRGVRSTELLNAQRQAEGQGGAAEEEPVWKITKQYSDETLSGHAAWISGDYKLHRIANGQGNSVKYELYNLAEDTNETTDIADDHPDLVAKLKAELDTWQKSVIGSLNGDDYAKP
jgi:arylsulfatase A-like enzyme